MSCRTRTRLTALAGERIHPFLASLIKLVCLASATHGFVQARHDPHRDAVRFIAAGQYDKVDKELSTADQQSPETQFVRLLNAACQNEIDASVKHARAPLDAGLPIERLIADPRESLAPLYDTDEFQQWLADSEFPPLIHGPMVGSVTSTSAMFWLRTATAPDPTVQFEAISIDGERIHSHTLRLSELQHD